MDPRHCRLFVGRVIAGVISTDPGLTRNDPNALEAYVDRALAVALTDELPGFLTRHLSLACGTPYPGADVASGAFPAGGKNPSRRRQVGLAGIRAACPCLMSRKWLLFGIALAVGCKRPDPKEVVHPLESTLGTAVPAAFVSTLAMSALAGRASPCATIVTPPSSNGHQVRVDIHLGPGCPMPFEGERNGTFVVTGVWTPELAVFASDFTQVEHRERELIVLRITVMTVVRGDAHLLISYQQQDVETTTTTAGTSTSARLEQTAWVVDVDTRGTEDLSDDRLTVSGGDQSLFAAAGARQQGDVTQVPVANAVFSAGCRRNPTQGIAAVQKAGTEGGGMLLFTFHSTCDGRADVTGAMAPYALMLGESVPLDFLE